MKSGFSIREVLEDRQYVLIPNFIEESIRSYLEFWIQQMWSSNRLTEKDTQSPESIAIGLAPPFEILLDYKTTEMCQITGKRLVPTYSYGRIYSDGSSLKRHKDRIACEYSVSACVSANNGLRWDLYVDDREGNRQYVKLNPGDALIYKGVELTHGRDTLICRPDQWMMQIFLHYVDTEGPYAAEKYDRRGQLGF